MLALQATRLVRGIGVSLLLQLLESNEEETLEGRRQRRRDIIICRKGEEATPKRWRMMSHKRCSPERSGSLVRARHQHVVCRVAVDRI